LEAEQQPDYDLETCSDEETVDIETTEEDPPASTETAANCWSKDQVSVTVDHWSCRACRVASVCVFLKRRNKTTNL
jgi:hypothetical protein